MTAIRHTLQREVFLPSEERLIGVVHVTIAGKKKKNSFLCAAVTTDQPAQVTVYKVKKSEKDTYKKRESWPLTDLKKVDGKDEAKDLPEFDLHFEKIYKWIASNVAEKNSFIACLWKLSQRYLVRKKPTFVNVNPQLLEETIQADEESGVKGEEEASDEDYQALSAREETDLEKMMEKCEFAISNAEAFTEQLSKDLSVLDGENIHSIMGSEEQVLTLMKLLDDGLDEVVKLEKRLDSYDEMLAGVKSHMEQMQQKDSLIQVQNKNRNKLIGELDNLIGQLDFSTQQIKALMTSELNSPNGILDCTAAAQLLQEKRAIELHPSLLKMTAVSGQFVLFNKLTEQFVCRLSTHLNGVFVQQGNEQGETLGRHSNELTLPKHYSSHRDLLPYTDLMLWLKRADQTSFTKLFKVYATSLSKLYDREIREFFESARMRVQGKDRRLFPHRDSKDRLSAGGSSGELHKAGSKVSSRASSLQDVTGSDPDISERQKFDKIFQRVLCELEPVVQAEYEFIVKFFHLGVDSSIPIQQTDDKQTEFTDGMRMAKSRKPTEKKVNNEVRHMMAELFQNLEAEFGSFIAFADKLDSFNSMYMLVRIGHEVMVVQDRETSLFLNVVLANASVQVKRMFDKFIQNQIRAIEETKVSKKSKCGIISFVYKFEEFADQAENIFKGSERRGDLDKAYTKLVQAIYESIERVAIEHQKTPRDVVMFENFHHLFATLSRLKISHLENEKKEAKQKYSDHLQSYVTTFLGRPLEKLNNFFEGIEARVAQGVKAEEVGYQLAFSKQELRKVIKEYPGKEVKKGLDHLYRKVEKTLCDEENLLQVVWHSMQDEFIRQYKYFEGIIEQCYPGANITLEFTIDEVLQFFSDIALSH
ncbi:exocyst complex component 1-like isoform X2 [Ptychodera flava]|uniref:exocyst complex component 1-like isoform X2 n=1 Tax=Ptychodera flava TaxID=63121 RepID=UPI00396A1EE6